MFKRKKVDPKQAFKTLRPYLSNIKFMIAVDPTYAAKWVDNANVYAVASAIKMHELRTAMRLEELLLSKKSTVPSWLKWVIPIGLLMLLLAAGINMVMSGGHPPVPSTGYNI